jgi:hypothetical protein
LIPTHKTVCPTLAFTSGGSSLHRPTSGATQVRPQPDLEPRAFGFGQKGAVLETDPHFLPDGPHFVVDEIRNQLSRKLLIEQNAHRGSPHLRID